MPESPTFLSSTPRTSFYEVRRNSHFASQKSPNLSVSNGRALSSGTPQRIDSTFSVSSSTNQVIPAGQQPLRRRRSSLRRLRRRFLRPSILALLLSAFAFSAQIMFASVVSVTFSPFQVLYARMFVQLVLSSCVLYYLRALPFPSGHDEHNSVTFLALCGRGVMGVICLGGLY
eukprot:PhM_4_TR2409/c0_g1_i2/m.16378